MTTWRKGMTQTFRGKPCRVCGGTLRYLSASQSCVACAQRRYHERKRKRRSATQVQEKA